MKPSIAVGLGLCLLFLGARAEEADPSRVLRDFQKAWKPLAGRDYMRPLDDQGWKARFTALHNLAGAGNAANAPLVGALKTGEDETRVFAAQVLALLADPAARPALQAALRDKQAAVRLYALDALSLGGKLPMEKPYVALAKSDPNRDVKSHATFAMERDDQPRPDALRRALREFDLNKLDTAKLGKEAPSFSLTDPNGKKVQLSDYRGKMNVVLVFVYGDT